MRARTHIRFLIFRVKSNSRQAHVFPTVCWSINVFGRCRKVGCSLPDWFLQGTTPSKHNGSQLPPGAMDRQDSTGDIEYEQHQDPQAHSETSQPASNNASNPFSEGMLQNPIFSGKRCVSHILPIFSARVFCSEFFSHHLFMSLMVMMMLAIV